MKREPAKYNYVNFAYNFGIATIVSFFVTQGIFWTLKQEPELPKLLPITGVSITFICSLVCIYFVIKSWRERWSPRKMAIQVMGLTFICYNVWLILSLTTDIFLYPH